MVTKIDHIGVAVESIEAARAFYEALGLEILAIEEVPSEGVRVAMIQLGETKIELLEPLSEDTIVGQFLARRGPGLHHICLATQDVRADSESLQEAGMRLLRAEPTLGAGGCWVRFVHPKSGGGVLYELSETARESRQRDDESQQREDPQEGSVEPPKLPVPSIPKKDSTPLPTLRAKR